MINNTVVSFAEFCDTTWKYFWKIHSWCWKQKQKQSKNKSLAIVSSLDKVQHRMAFFRLKRNFEFSVKNCFFYFLLSLHEWVLNSERSKQSLFFNWFRNKLIQIKRFTLFLIFHKSLDFFNETIYILLEAKRFSVLQNVKVSQVT